MKLSIYLHSYITDVLNTFGNLNDVVNKILDASDEGYFDIENKPACEPREGASRYDIEITNTNYLNMLKIFGVKSKAISLRRLIYWFVDNEIYNEIGWEAVNDYVDKYDARWNKQIDKIVNELDRLKMIDTYNCENNINDAMNLILTCRR